MRVSAIRREVGGKSRRVIAKVEWHPGELFPRVGFIVANMGSRSKSVVAFYNQRGTAEQWIKEGKGAIKWTRLSCRLLSSNAVRLQLHDVAYNLGNFLRTLAMPEPIKDWSLTSLREKLIKIGAKVVSHGRYIASTFAHLAGFVQNAVHRRHRTVVDAFVQERGVDVRDAAIDEAGLMNGVEHRLSLINCKRQR
jgi:hypothetical protein